MERYEMRDDDGIKFRDIFAAIPVIDPNTYEVYNKDGVFAYGVPT